MFVRRHTSILTILGVVSAACGVGGCDTIGDSGDAPTSSMRRVERQLLMSRPIARQPGQPEIELSNPRFHEGTSKIDKLRTKSSETFEVDWELRSGKLGGKWSLVVKTPEGRTMRVEATPLLPLDFGTMAGEITTIGLDDAVHDESISQGCEMYVVLDQADMEFKVSNSITVGDVSATPTREPTDAERTKLRRTRGVAERPVP